MTDYYKDYDDTEHYKERVRIESKENERKLSLGYVEIPSQIRPFFGNQKWIHKDYLDILRDWVKND
jgi:hypothetical protein